MTESPSAAVPQTLAEKLHHLRDATRPKGRTRGLSSREIAAAVRARGVDTSHTYIARLLNGTVTDPHTNLLRALAKVFGVPPSYLIDDPAEAGDGPPDADVFRDLELLAALRDERVRLIAKGSRGLPEAAQESVLAVIRQLQELLQQRGGPGTHRIDE